jgi:hypothetical protein
MKKKAKSPSAGRSATAQKRQAETRRQMTTSPRGLTAAERQGIERSNAASQGAGSFPGTASGRIIDLTPNAEEGDQVFIGKKPVRAQKKAPAKKMAKGGTCRGMGAATRGGSYKAG